MAQQVKNHSPIQFLINLVTPQKNLCLAYARCIYPVGTLYDGDSIYAVSLGKVKADVNAIGTLAAEVMQEAILRAVRDSKISDEEYLANCPK